VGSGRGLGLALILLAAAGGLVLWRHTSAEVGALGWLTLAAIAGIVASGRIGRRLIAVLLALTAVGIGWFGAASDIDGIVQVGAAMVIGIVAVATWRYAAQWPGMSSRYGAPRDRPSDPWTELDAGRDPTA
jgi:hypothetical protein